MTTTDTATPLELWTWEQFGHRLPLNRRQFESLNAVPSVKLTPKGRKHYRAAQVDAWILTTLAPLAGGAA